MTPIPRGLSAEDRFWAKVEKTATCWLWRGAISADGYGNFGLEDGRTGSAHRVSYEWIVGPIPEGAVIDHLCRVRTCVNPAHLEPVTNAVNLQRGVGPELASLRNVDQTFCLHGHPLFGDNLYVQPKTGYRYCRTCQRRRRAEYQARKRAT